MKKYKNESKQDFIKKIKILSPCKFDNCHRKLYKSSTVDDIFFSKLMTSKQLIPFSLFLICYPFFDFGKQRRLK